MSSPRSRSPRPSLQVDPAGQRHERIVLEEPLTLKLEKITATRYGHGPITSIQPLEVLTVQTFTRELPAGSILWVRFPEPVGAWPPFQDDHQRAIADHLRAWAAEIREGPIWQRGTPELILARAERVEKGLS